MCFNYKKTMRSSYCLHIYFVRLHHWNEQLYPLFYYSCCILELIRSQNPNNNQSATKVVMKVQDRMRLWNMLDEYCKGTCDDAPVYMCITVSTFTGYTLDKVSVYFNQTELRQPPPIYSTIAQRICRSKTDSQYRLTGNSVNINYNHKTSFLI